MRGPGGWGRGGSGTAGAPPSAGVLPWHSGGSPTGRGARRPLGGGGGAPRTARPMHTESLTISREIGHRWGIGTSVLYLGIIAWMEDDLEGARSSFEEGLQLKRETGDQAGMVVALDFLGEIARRQGNSTAARG